MPMRTFTTEEPAAYEFTDAEVARYDSDTPQPGRPGAWIVGIKSTERDFAMWEEYRRRKAMELAVDFMTNIDTMGGEMVTGQGNPQQRLTPTRVGFDPPQTLIQLRKDVERAVLNTCQVPPALVTDADGTSQRESYRRFVVAAVEPVLKRLSDELVLKLDLTPASAAFDVHGLHGHDIAGRAKAFQTLVAAGKSAEEAAKLAGLRIELAAPAARAPRPRIPCPLRRGAWTPELVTSSPGSAMVGYWE